MRLASELAPVFVRVHTRVKRKRRRREREWTHPKTWANFALVFDWETTTDLREDLNFLWWRFCELKNGVYRFIVAAALRTLRGLGALLSR
jgi:hypothetical protein